MRNFVAKHDFNRATVHKTAKDYQRLSKHELLEELMEEDWGVYPDDTLEEDIPLKDPKQWESINETAHQ